MQTYPLILPANGVSVTINVVGDLFVYESGVATPTTGDTRIAIKPDNGEEVILRPGQRVRMPETASRWTVYAFDKLTQIAGFSIIGSGEFDDANTKNTFTLDAQFANNVTVMNAAGNEVPVKINNTTASRVPVALDPAQVLNVAGASVNYTNSFSNASVTGGAVEIFNAAANANGAWVELMTTSISVSAQATMELSLIAKASAPGSIADGDVLNTLTAASGGASTPAPYLTIVNDRMTARVKVPAGKGLYLFQSATGSPSVSRKTVLYTLL